MKMLVISCALGALVSVRSEGAPPSLPTPDVTVVQQAEKREGISSWDGEEREGNPTASGEIFDRNGLTAAHNTLPLGTWIRVTNLKNGRSVVLRVNDRGPGIPGRLLDVSMEAARQLQVVPNGLTQFQIELISSGHAHQRNPRTQVSSRCVEGPGVSP